MYPGEAKAQIELGYSIIGNTLSFSGNIDLTSVSPTSSIISDNPVADASANAVVQVSVYVPGSGIGFVEETVGGTGDALQGNPVLSVISDAPPWDLAVHI